MFPISHCPPYACNMEADPQLECFEMYGKRNYNHLKNIVETIQASWGDEMQEELAYWQALDKTAGVFPCRSFNLGKQTVAHPHLDEKNLAQSWCSITPLGDFDPDFGGHLVLSDFKLIIRFPAGSTVLIPSVLLYHSNTPIQSNETRYSIIQYAAGGLARWVHNGLMSDKGRLAGVSEEGIQSCQAEQESYWKTVVEMYTQLDEV
jgi:hypothetical protein